MSDSNQVNWEVAAKTRELDLKEREVVAREREVAARQNELNKSPWSNPTFIALVAASLGLFGNLVVTVLNNMNARALEHQHSQSDLVLEAIRTGSPEKACTNLIGFINAGLLDDTGGTISKKCSSSPATAPYLPAGTNPFTLTSPFVYSNGILSLNAGQPSTTLTGTPSFNFQGLVIDASTLAPIPGANVSADELGKTETNSFGVFGFTLPLTVSGKFVTIKAEKDGYEPGSGITIPFSGGSITIQLRKK